MAEPGITSIKSFTYRGNVEEWGNTYHFDGDPPANPADWLSLYEALVDLEKPIFASSLSIVRAYCYEDTDDHSVLTLDADSGFSPVSGTLSITGAHAQAPGDAAAWCRWKTARVNSKGNPIYLRKYFHGVITQIDGGDGDNIAAEQKTALQNFADDVNAPSGDWPGLVGPDGVVPGANRVSTYATTRTLKRRGARPH